MPRPIPPAAPVTMATRSLTCGSACSSRGGSDPRWRGRLVARVLDTRRRVVPVVDLAPLDLRGPLAPERAHLQLVVHPRLTQHAAADVVELLAAGFEPDLAGLQGLDVVGCRKSARPQELQEVVEPSLKARARLLDGSDCPCIDLHEVRPHGVERAYGGRHDVVDHEVGVDQQVAVPLRDPLATVGPVALIEFAADRVDLRLAL